MEAPNPVVSVGLPTYNRPQWLKGALRSVMDQTYRELEVIVSDNGTPGEEVGRLVEEMMSQDKRIRYRKQPRNIGAIGNFCRRRFV
jgi:glycosyltransferase involved in cell wall biosynthesis